MWMERRMIVRCARHGKGGAGHWIQLLLGAAVSAPDRWREDLGVHGLGGTCAETEHYQEQHNLVYRASTGDR